MWLKECITKSVDKMTVVGAFYIKFCKKKATLKKLQVERE